MAAAGTTRSPRLRNWSCRRPTCRSRPKRWAQALVYRNGNRLLVVDPWTEIDQSQRGTMSMTDWVDLCLKRLRRFGREYGVHVVIVAHLRKMQAEVDREGTRKMPVVTPCDVAESRHWYEMADICLSTWRDKSDPEEPVQVHVQKICFIDNGELGLALFRYDPVIRRDTDVSDRFGEDEYRLEHEMVRARKRDNSEAMKRRGQRHIENGLCVLCGSNKATTGKQQGGTTLCDPCRAKQHRWTMESARKRAARKKGMCDVCFTRPAVAGLGSGTRCEAC